MIEFSNYINKKDTNKSIQKQKEKYLKLLNEKDKDFKFVKKLLVDELTKKINNNQNRIKNIEDHIKEIYDFDCIIVDECHQLKRNNSVCTYIQKINTNCKFGLTGTLPDNTEDIWNVKGLIGPVLAHKQVYDLQQQKFIANVNIIPVLFEHKTKPKFVYHNSEEAKMAFYDEWNHIESVDKSNLKIAQLTNKLKGNTLLLFDHRAHGKLLFNAVDSDNKFFIDGSVDIEDRDDIKVKMENNTSIILVGNVKAVGTGISIKNIDNIVFAISGKGVTKIIQAVGRGLRLLDGKTKVNLFDIHHNFHYSIKHFETRKDLYLKFYNKLIDQYHTIKI